MARFLALVGNVWAQPFHDEGLSLLQTRARPMKVSAAENETRAGQQVWTNCFLWGDPHPQGCHHGCWGEPSQPGLFTLSSSPDGRFKAQAYLCPVTNEATWMNMIGIEIDGHKIRFLPPRPEDGSTTMGGKPWGFEEGYVMIDDDPKVYKFIQFFDDGGPSSIPGTGIIFERSQTLHNINGQTIIIKHPDVQYTVGLGPGNNNHHYHWEVHYSSRESVPPDDGQQLCAHGNDQAPVPWEQSMFTADDHSRVCTWCENWGKWGSWLQAGSYGPEAYSCDQPPPQPPRRPAQDVCEDRDCSYSHAMQLCSSVKGHDALYNGCLMDYCSLCEASVADEALVELADITMAPTCAPESPQCDPEEACAKSVKMNVLSPTQNNLGGVGPDSGAEELRFGNAAAIDGRPIDLVVTADGEFPVYKADKVGVTGAFGRISLSCGKSVTLDFQAQDSETGEAVNLEMVTITWYDLDEGKRAKGRATVSVCGSTGAITSSDTELTLTRNSGCDSATSSMQGNGKDNPKDPFNLDKVQRARSVSFPLSNVKTFSSTLSLEKGYRGRNFLFAIEPSIACPSALAAEAE